MDQSGFTIHPVPHFDSDGKGGIWVPGRGLAVPNPCLGQASRLRSQELDGRPTKHAEF